MGSLLEDNFHVGNVPGDNKTGVTVKEVPKNKIVMRENGYIRV